MLKLSVCFTAILLYCSSEIIWQSNATPHDSKAMLGWNKTTTAIPMYNVSKAVAVPNTPTTSDAGSPMTPRTNGHYARKTTAGMNSSVQPETTSEMVSPTDPAVSYDQQEKRDNFFVPTTAISPSVGPVLSDHHFDSLSFTGGTLLAISVIAVGTLAWKMYIARIERSYWTL